MKVGTDGKLTEAEREWRRKAGLCMYCAQLGHKAADCPVRKASGQAKARAANADESATPEDSTPTATIVEVTEESENS